MTRRITRIVPLVVALVIVSGHSAIAGPPRQLGGTRPDPLVVQISKGQVRLAVDGTVFVPLRARCMPPLGTFELDVSVLQGSTFGSVFRLEPGVVPCDGRWHGLSARVPAQVGGARFVAGVATVDVFLGAFDPDAGIDTEARDSVTVVLRAPDPPRAVCGVKNETQDTWFAADTGSALTSAITAANPGDQLNVFGRCVGTYVLDKDLTLSGSPRFPTILDAAGQGRVLFVAPGATVVIDRLIVTGGNHTTPGGGGGINLSEGGTLTLNRSIVTGNSTTGAGGGIVSGGSLTLNASLVARNHADADGGGIFNFGEVVVNGSWLIGNTSDGAGGGLFNEGSAVVSRSRIRFNIAASAGGILNVSLLTLSDSVVSSNQPDDCVGC